MLINTVMMCVNLSSVSNVYMSFYLVDPVIEVGDAGEDGGFLDVVAALAGDEASDAMHLPYSRRVLTVQWATRVTLKQNTKHFISLKCLPHRLMKI